MSILHNKKKIVLFGAGQVGRKYLQIIGEEKVFGFVDNNEKLWGTFIASVKVYKFDELLEKKNDFSWIISTSEKYKREIEQILCSHSIEYSTSIEQYLMKDYFKSLDWLSYKNSHKGESCFVLGSGPSLKAEDLDELYKNNIWCFAANKIFKIFEYTRWRPDYYVATDRRILKFYKDDIVSLPLKEKFIAYYSDKSQQEFYNSLIDQKAKIFEIVENTSEEGVNFSEDPSRFLVEGRTVIYAMMQIARYMGFTNMYLLGVDFDYKDKTGYDKGANDHFCKDYIKEGEEVLITPEMEAKKTFSSAEKYSRDNNFRIFNSTRGGKLEVFERIPFEKAVERCKNDRT